MASTNTPWGVFLSFRGIDTRYTFTDHLYHALHRNGVRTFKDDPELHSGEVISDSLIQAIQESKTYIVVLSENYASSSWCLDELVEILSCYKQMKRLVVPVFYYIDPSVVRRQIGSFKEAFDKHQTRYDVEKVNNWRLTLNEVAGFSGYHISQNRSQADIVDEVVERVLLEINPVTLNVAKYPVGLDSRVKGVTALFDSDVEAVIKIGIHGMGGVGKTTLAKSVYNLHYRRFQGSCFLANVREVSRAKGVVCLQQQLINDVLKCNNINIASADHGIELIRDRICSKKVLIVVDDLDDPKPLECLGGPFALGSIVIITTRNEDTLDRIKVKAKYKVDRMDKDESYKLFTQHAFGDETISDTFVELSKEILKRAGGLPLALQVFGSNLLSESEDGWRKFIDKLKRTPNDDVKENLMVSFNALKSVDPFLQDIFLDIACFYIGWKKEKAAKVMETYYTFVNHNIDILKKRSLITINDRDELGMHDLLWDMGRNIARNNSPDEPGNNSRLWVSEDIDTVLKNQKGTEAIHGIISGNFDYEEEVEGVTFNAESFKRMSKLRFLYLNNVNLTGSFEQTFEDLRWLRWVHCPLECLPSKFYPQKLVILELPVSNMRTMGEQNMVFEKLKTLDMSKSRNLTTTPDFSGLPCLETLNLAGCSKLEEVHISIGILVRLVSLNLEYCSNLRSLPDSICRLRALEVLTVDGCTRLEAFPTELGSIESLKTLKASGLSVSKLPNLSNLKQLEDLSLSNCRGLTEIKGLEELTSLRKLYLTGCKSSLQAHTLTNRFFEILSGFGHKVEIYMGRKEFPDWISTLPSEFEFVCYCLDLGIQFELGSRILSLDLQPNGSYNFLAIILAFKDTTDYADHYEFKYWVENVTSGLIWSDTFFTQYPESLIVIVPSSILSIRGGDKIKLKSDQIMICEIHLLYKTENTVMSEYFSTTDNVEDESSCPLYSDWESNTIVNVEEERSYPFHSALESNRNWFSLGSSSTTVNVEEERSYPFHSALESNRNWFSLGSSSTTVNVEEERSYPFHSALESNRNWFSLGSSSTTVNVEEKRSYPFHSALESNRNWFSLGSSSTTVNVEEERSYPFHGALESNRKWFSLGSSSTTMNVEDEEERNYPFKWLKRS